MATIKITPEQLAGLLKKGDETIRKGISTGLLAGAARGGALLASRGPVGVSGVFKNAWKPHRTDQGAFLHNDAPYGGIIEKGARPHNVNAEGVQAIFEWVQRVAKPVAQQGGDADKAAWSMTWAIINKLKTEGQKGTHFVENALEELATLSGQEVVRSIVEAMERLTP